MRGTNHKLWQQESFYKQNTTHNNCADAWVTNTKHLVWTSSVYKTNPTTYRSSYCARHTRSVRDTKAHKIWKQTKTVSVPFCLSVRISPEPHVPSLPIFCACCLWPLLSPPLAGWQNPKGKRAILEVFFDTDNALYSIAFKTHTKNRLNRSTRLLGWLLGLARGTVLREGDDRRRGGAILTENMCPISPIPLIIVKWIGPCSSTQQGLMLGCKRWTSLLMAAKWGCTSGFVDDIVFFSTVSHIEVWITLRSTDFTYIYLFIINLDRIWFNITKWHNVV